VKDLQKDRPDEGIPPPEGEDYFVLSTRYDTWYVSAVMCRAIEESLDADPKPEWITFVDLTGARIRTQARAVETIAQCSAEQRASAREFGRRMRLEARADRSWDDDD
jgi:hypothetical protein